MEHVRKAFRNANFAKTNADKLASSVFVIGGIFTLWYEFYHVILTYDLSSSWWTWNFIVAMWCYVNAMTNWYFMISTRIYPFYTEVEQKKASDWQYCERCFAFYPPRTHHCKICNICVLKRDHHCWFGGTCIGYHNHRYYLIMIVYIWFAALYCNIFNAIFVYRVVNGFSIGSIFSLAFPHGAAMVGLLNFYQFCICTVSFLGFFLLIMFSLLLEIQIVQIYKGQTKYEKKKGITDYNIGWKRNLIDVLGARYYLVMFSAFIPSPLPGDGVSFQKITKDQ